MSEDQWVSIAKTMKTRPPMPWYSINSMSDDDLRAIHKFVRSLGPAGSAPQALPPGGNTQNSNGDDDDDNERKVAGPPETEISSMSAFSSA